MKKHLIFDFDWTIADTFDLVVEWVNLLAPKFGYTPIADEEIPLLKEKTLPELLREHGVALRMTPFLSWLLKRYIQKNIHRVTLIPWIQELIEDLHTKWWEMWIVSSNSVKNIEHILLTYALRKPFSYIHSTRAIFWKNRTLKKYCSLHTVKNCQCVYIADEVRDVKACQRINFPIISVAWWYNSAQLLTREGAMLVVSDPKELLNSIEHGEDPL